METTEETKAVEPAQEPTQAPQVTQPREETIGDIMKEATRRGIVKAVVTGSVIVYLGMVVYAEAHGINLLTKGVAPDFLIWAYMGMIALGLTAILLPLALHFWTHEFTHKLAAFLFYALDLTLLFVNSFTDYGGNTGQQLASWAQLYKDYVMPATPVIAGMGWAVLWLLDPSSRALAQRLTLRTAIMQKKSDQVMKAASDPRFNAIVDAAAQQEVEDTLAEFFGRPVVGYVMNAEPQPQRRTAAQSFFDGLFSLARRALSSVMDTPSRPSDSSQQDEAEQ